MPAPELEEDSVDLTPMIDVVFLLLIFFMVTMRIVQEETELIIPLPSNVTPPEPPEHLPQNINIEIDPFGQVSVDGQPMDKPDERSLPQLTAYLLRRGQMDARGPAKTIINITPDGQARHKHTINVLNSLTKANRELDKLGIPKDRLLKQITFQ